MAKRYYDLALETNTEAYLPVKLSLLKLRARGYWNRITNGNINPIRDDEGKTNAVVRMSPFMELFLTQSL